MEGGVRTVFVARNKAAVALFGVRMIKNNLRTVLREIMAVYGRCRGVFDFGT